MFFAQVHQRMYGITGFGQMKFDIRSFYLEMIVDRSAYHIEAIELMQQSFRRLKRILRGDHHPNFFEIGRFGHDVGDDEVPNMDGVERAEKQTYLQGYAVSGVATGIKWKSSLLKIIVQTLGFGQGFAQVFVHQYNVKFIMKPHFEFCFEQTPGKTLFCFRPAIVQSFF